MTIYDWSKAPEWAEWAATRNGVSCWCSSDPDEIYFPFFVRTEQIDQQPKGVPEGTVEQRPASGQESDPTGRKSTDPGAKLGAIEILGTAQQALLDRAASRDRPEGERSMALTVRIFNSATGRDLSESEGWQFMMALKWARANNGNRHNADDAVDLAGFSALWGECEGQSS